MSFDETNLVPNAGLLPAAVLAQRIDLVGLVDRRLRLAKHGANSGAKALSVIGSMLAGGDSIDDVAVLRAGAGASLFDGTRAPSTVGSWLRAHKWSNVRQLDAISRELLARLWSAGAGPADPSAPLTIDLDSTVVQVHGRAKQGAAFGYTKVRGYHPQLATCAQTGQVLMSRLRGGSAGAARGAASFLTETISRVRNAGATGQLTVRADSAFYSKAMLATAAKFDVRFSITARQDKRVRGAMGRVEDLVAGNEIFQARTRGVGVLSPEQIHAYGVSGPIARASGVDFDLRRDAPYLAYDRLDVRVVTRSEGDCLARFQCLLEQVQVSLDLAEA